MRSTNIVLSYRYGTSTPASYVPMPESECGRCGEHAPHAFIVVPAVEMEEWMCTDCIADLDAKGAEHNEIISAKELAKRTARRCDHWANGERCRSDAGEWSTEDTIEVLGPGSGCRTLHLCETHARSVRQETFARVDGPELEGFQ